MVFEAKKQKVEEKFGAQKSEKGKCSIKDETAYAAGIVAGSRIQWNKAVTSTEQNKRLQ